ncbi:MAG: hypothetical protein HY908_17200 [Myxococcales bacterium]|nr:hypothetical protein [Myxococcales bacterium]
MMMASVKSVGLPLAAFVATTVCLASQAFAQQPPPADPAPAPAPAPAAAPAPAPQTVVVLQGGSSINSPGLVAGGGVMIGLGGLGLIIGIPVTIAGAALNNACDTLDASGACKASGVSTTLAVGITMDVLSAGMIAGGIAMVVIGSQPATATVAERDPLLPEVRLGAGNAQAKWTF